MNRLVCLAGLITLAVLVILPSGIMDKSGQVTSEILDEAWNMISQRGVDSKAKSDVQEHLDQYLNGIEEQIQGKSNLQVLPHSEELGIFYEYPPNGKGIPFQIASIGKVFTATLLCMLADKGDLS